MSDKQIYFMRPVGQLGPIKIGCSRMPQGRLETIAIQPPVRLEIVAMVPGSHGEERRLHGMFRKHWLHHEWFSASKELLALVEYVVANDRLPPLPEGRVIPLPRKKPAKQARKPRQKRERSGRKYQVADVKRAEEMRALYLGGGTLESIGQQYGLTRERVRQILRAFDVPSLGTRPEHRRHAAPVTEQEREMARLYSEGTPPRVLATMFPDLSLSIVLRRTNTRAKGVGYWNTHPETDEITAKVAEMYLAGHGPTAIRAALSPRIKHIPTVYYYLRRAGIEPRYEKGDPLIRKKWDRSKEAGARTKAEVIRLRGLGFSYAQISAALNINPTTVAHHLRAAGLTRSKTA